MSDLAFNNLLFQLCESDLDEKLRQLLSIFRDRLPGESRETVQSVPVLFDNLRELGVLDIDDLNPLREALRLVEKQDLVAQVEEFEAQRREGLRNGTLQRHVVNRGVVSLQRAAGRLSCAISMKTAFKLAAGGVVFVAVYKILGRCSSIEEFCNVFNSCVLPAGTKLMELGEGSLNFMVKADDLAALKALWNRYQEGKLREDLQNFLVTEEIQHLGNGEELEVTVTIDEDEYNDACLDLMTTRGFHDPANIYTRIDDKHRAILQEHYVKLEKDLEPMKVLSHLFQKRVLDEEDKATITAEKTPQGKTRKLIDILLTKPPNAFGVFVSALEKVQPHLACPLLRAEMAAVKQKLETIEKELSVEREENSQLSKEYKELENKYELLQREHETALTRIKEMQRQPSFQVVTAPPVKEMGATSRPRSAQIWEKLRREKREIQEGSDEMNELRSSAVKGRSIPKARAFSYRSDFDQKGVIYALSTNFGSNSYWVNPAGSGVSNPITVTRSSSCLGEAKDLLSSYKHTKEKTSSTEDEEMSWWCVDLGKKYSLFLTHYTLRHGRDDAKSCLRTWNLEGSHDGENWPPQAVLDTQRDHEWYTKHEFAFMTKTWPIEFKREGQEAYRFFRIVQTNMNSSGRFDIYLSGMELYGVLLDMSHVSN